MATRPQASARPTKDAAKGNTGEATSSAEADERLVPSELDDSTHAELLNLIDESSRAILFAKAQQWKTVGATLLVFVALIALARYVSNTPRYLEYLQIIVFLATPAAILILIMYQFWQHTELAKLQTAGMNFSSLYRKIRKIKSGREANAHRYLIFAFMVGVIVLGAVLTLASFGAIHSGPQ